MSLDQYLLSNM